MGGKLGRRKDRTRVISNAICLLFSTDSGVPPVLLNKVIHFLVITLLLSEGSIFLFHLVPLEPSLP